MRYFNTKLAPYLEEEKLNDIIRFSQKPVSLRYIARRFNLTVYAVKRLLEYYNNSQNVN